MEFKKFMSKKINLYLLLYFLSQLRFNILCNFYFFRNLRLFKLKKGEINEAVLVIILVIFMILLAIGYVIFKIRGIKEAVGLG